MTCDDCTYDADYDDSDVDIDHVCTYVNYSLYYRSVVYGSVSMRHVVCLFICLLKKSANAGDKRTITTTTILACYQTKTDHH